MVDKAAVSKLGEMDPELAAFLKGIKNSPPPPDRPDLAGCRKLFAEREKAMRRPDRDLLAYHHARRLRGPCEDHQPTHASESGKHPLVVLFSGGGFFVGSPEQMTPDARSFARLFGAVCVCPSYRLAPEFKFPTAANDCWDSLKWINASLLGAAPSAGFVVGGVSARGNLAAALAQLAQDENLEPSLTGQWLAIPVLLDQAIVPEKYKDVYFSQEQNVNALGLNKKSFDEMAAYSQPDVHSPLYSPLNSAAPGTGLPPAYIQVCGLDVVRDDALIYEKVLKEQGVKTRLDVYAGLPHGFWAVFPQLNSSRKAAVDIAKGMGWLLGKGR
ncbi:MAG: hypothetical protein M1830_003002 [Pleopsidium flavum]|nr:MAG: hypothetical protein M1830_003002 [Pleopsidium flavum]